MKILKKILFGIIIACALFGATYLFLAYYNTNFNLTEIYTTYRDYLIVAFLSIIGIYLFLVSNKKIARIGILAIILINFFRLIGFFSENIIDISQNALYVIAGLLVLGFLTSYIKNWIRIPLISIISIAFIITLLSSFLPMYKNTPDIEGFIKNQEPLLIIQSEDSTETLKSTEAQITIKYANEEKKINLTNTSNLKLKSLDAKFIFSSKTGLKNSNAHILLPQGNIITLTPQSAINIIQEEKLPPLRTKKEFYDIEIIQGAIGLYTTETDPEMFITTGNLSGITLNKAEDLKQIIDTYTQKKEEYLIEQIGGEIMFNPNVDGFIGRYLNIANSTIQIVNNLLSYMPIDRSIASLDQNILNYNEFHGILPYQSRGTYKAAEEINQKILNKTNDGLQSTKIKSRRDDLIETINTLFSKKSI